jgi:uncharacterized DUF497 family protein
LNERHYQFDWDEKKLPQICSNMGVTFLLASTVFLDPGLLTSADLEHGPEERCFSIGSASDGKVLAVSYLWSERQPMIEVRNHFSPPSDTKRDSSLRGEPMSNQPVDDDMPVEIDFSKAERGLHHIPAAAKVFLPTSRERSVWQYYSNKAQQKGVALSELVTDVLKRDMTPAKR